MKKKISMINIIRTFLHVLIQQALNKCRLLILAEYYICYYGNYIFHEYIDQHCIFIFVNRWKQNVKNIKKSCHLKYFCQM